MNNLSYLTENQRSVFLFLLAKKNFKTSNAEINRQTGISYGSVRHAINSLIKNNVILKPVRCRYQNRNGFEFRFHKKIHLSAHLSEQVPGQVIKTSPALIERKKEFFFNKNLSFFWSKQGLKPKQIEKWMNEFKLSEDDIDMFLQFSEKIKNFKEADNPVRYFYGCLKRGEYPSRPKGFEFPEERQARIKKEELEARKRLIEEKKKLRQQEKALAEEESFLALLKDKKIIEKAIKEFEQGHMTTKFKISVKTFKASGQVDEKLENRLRMWLRDSKECT